MTPRMDSSHRSGPGPGPADIEPGSAERRSGGPTAAGARSSASAGMPRMVAPETMALVPAGGRFEGEVALLGDSRIDGQVHGSVRGGGTLRIGPDALIEGALECDEVEIEGQIRGPIVARSRLALGPGAQVDGDVETPSLELCEGAVWNGRARVGGIASEPGPEPLPEPGPSLTAPHSGRSNG